jgi:hypothetical protein
MLFVILFAIGALAVPLAWDISRKGRNNILQRSGQDLLEHPSVQRFPASVRSTRISTSLRVARGGLRPALVGSAMSVAFIIIAYFGIKLLNLLGSVVFYAVNLHW